METYKFINELKIDSYSSKKREVRGMLAHYDIPTSHGEVFKKGCFSNCIKFYKDENKKLPLNYIHFEDRVIGSFTELYEVEDGLFGVAKLDDIPFVNDVVIEQLENKTLQNFSICGTSATNKDVYYDAVKDLLYFNNAVLFETSLVPLGADIKANIEFKNKLRKETKPQIEQNIDLEIINIY